MPVKGKKPHVRDRIGDFFDVVRDFAVRFRVFDFADFCFWGITKPVGPAELPHLTRPGHVF